METAASQRAIGLESTRIRAMWNWFDNAFPKSANFDTLRTTLADEGFLLSATAKLMPIYAHRYVVCDGAEENCPVLSIWDFEDAIVYGNTFREYLEKEFLGKTPS
jgi:hypothetical protein